MSKTLPVLGSEGWLKDPEQTMVRLFTDMFITDYSQSNIFHGQVASLQYYLTTLNGDPIAITEAVERMITSYYGRYFDTVSCSFKHDDSLETELAFDLSIEAYRAGTRYDLARRVVTDSSTGTQRFMESFDYSGEINE